MDNKIDYFIKRTDERFDKIEAKLDQLIAFRLFLIGASVGVSGLVSIAFHLLINWAGK